MISFNFIDVFRSSKPDSRKYTWSSPSNKDIQTRIDFIWASPNWQDYIINGDILAADIITESDHSIVFSHFDVSTIIRNFNRAQLKRNGNKRRIYEYNKMDTEKWKEFMTEVDVQFDRRSNLKEILLMNDKALSECNSDDIWNSIQDAYLSAANKSILFFYSSSTNELSPKK